MMLIFALIFSVLQGYALGQNETVPIPAPTLTPPVAAPVVKRSETPSYYINFAKNVRTIVGKWENIEQNMVSSDLKSITGSNYTIQAVGDGATLSFANWIKEPTIISDALKKASKFYSVGLYKSEIYASGSITKGRILRATFEVPPGEKYDVNLHFAEHYAGVKTANGRNFFVNIAGPQGSVNVTEEATEVQRAVRLQYGNITAPRSGKLQVNLIKNLQNPFLNAIEVYPTGKFRN